jgi:DnaK suppressor protein
MAKKPARRSPGTSVRGPRSLRARIQQERDAAIARLQQLRMSAEHDDRSPAAGNDSALDEGDAAQVSEQRDVRFATHERLARRINQLTAALERLDRDDYGRCTICGQDIHPNRLLAIPEAATCVACQQRQERSGSPEAVA